MSHVLELMLEVDREPEAILLNKAVSSDVEVIELVDEFMRTFVKPDCGSQKIKIVVISRP